MFDKAIRRMPNPARERAGPRHGREPGIRNGLEANVEVESLGVAISS